MEQIDIIEDISDRIQIELDKFKYQLLVYHGIWTPGSLVRLTNTINHTPEDTGCQCSIYKKKIPIPISLKWE